jgi:hypothetical protein
VLEGFQELFSVLGNAVADAYPGAVGDPDDFWKVGQHRMTHLDDNASRQWVNRQTPKEFHIQ